MHWSEREEPSLVMIHSETRTPSKLNFSRNTILLSVTRTCRQHPALAQLSFLQPSSRCQAQANTFLSAPQRVLSYWHKWDIAARRPAIVSRSDKCTHPLRSAHIHRAEGPSSSRCLAMQRVPWQNNITQRGSGAGAAAEHFLMARRPTHRVEGNANTGTWPELQVRWTAAVDCTTCNIMWFRVRLTYLHLEQLNVRS